MTAFINLLPNFFHLQLTLFLSPPGYFQVNPKLCSCVWNLSPCLRLFPLCNFRPLHVRGLCLHQALPEWPSSSPRWPTAPMSGCLSFYYQLQQRNGNIFSVYEEHSWPLWGDLKRATQGMLSGTLLRWSSVPHTPRRYAWCAGLATLQRCHRPGVAQETLQPHTHPSSFVSQSPSPFSLPWPLPLFSLPLYSLCLPPPYHFIF